MKHFIQRHSLVIVTTLLGAVGGFLYWKYIGCLSGTCQIRSVWYLSTLYGAIAGYVVGDISKAIWTRLRKPEDSGSVG